MSRFYAARKCISGREHWCDECLDWIPKGERMVRTRARAPDASWNVRHFHSKCWKVHLEKCSACETRKVPDPAERWARCKRCLDAVVKPGIP